MLRTADMYFDWDDANILHLARHNIAPEEAEQVLMNDPMELEEQHVDGEDRYTSVGETNRGRMLVILATFRGDLIRVISGWDSEASTKRKYFLWKGQPMATTLEIPKFANEAEEADWWYDNRHLVEERFRSATSEGRVGNGTLMRRALEAQAMIQLDAADAQRARLAAERKGMTYQAYVKMLVHEALDQKAEAA